jgi:hypothetical protein
MKKHIKVTWKAFGESVIHNEYITSVEFDLDTEDSALAICERVFHDTNTYNGSLWDIIEPLLWDNRTHTALSVRDEVEVDGTTFRCDSVGWTPLCDWQVEVPSGNPEPDQPSDLWSIVPCHGEVEPILRNGVDVGWRCSNGHEWVSEEHKTDAERYEEFLADAEGAF